MVDVVVDHVIPQQCHPFFILSAIHMTAPFANQQRCDVFSVDICPSIIPIVIQQRLFREILIKPSLVINRRTIVMRRIDNLACTGIRLNRIIPNATQIAAPPCTIPRRNICRSLPDVSGIIGIALFRLWILFYTLYKNQSIWVDIQDGICTFRCRVCPVVQIGGIIPFCNICRTSCTIIATLSVRFVLQVIANQGIIILIFICQPSDGIFPHIPCNLFAGICTYCHVICISRRSIIIPQIIVMTRVMGCRTVYIHHDLNAVFLHLLHNNVEDFHTVFCRVFAISVFGEFRIGVAVHALYFQRFAIHPRTEQFRRNRHSYNVNAVVCNIFYKDIDVCCI